MPVIALGGSGTRTLWQPGGVLILTPGSGSRLLTSDFCPLMEGLEAFHTEVTEATRDGEHGDCLLFLRALCERISVPSVRTLFRNQDGFHPSADCTAMRKGRCYTHQDLGTDGKETIWDIMMTRHPAGHF
jgi:hypothetical protein